MMYISWLTYNNNNYYLFFKKIFNNFFFLYLFIVGAKLVIPPGEVPMLKSSSLDKSGGE